MQINEYNIELADEIHPSLIKERTFAYNVRSLMSPTDIRKLLDRTVHLSKKAEEYVYMIAFNSKMVPTGIFEIAHGTVDRSLITPREVFMRALLSGAKYIVLAHNHPSGDATPSDYDNKVFAEIDDAGKLLKIYLVDHIIVGKGVFSYAENKCIKKG